MRIMRDNAPVVFKGLTINERLRHGSIRHLFLFGLIRLDAEIFRACVPLLLQDGKMALVPMDGNDKAYTTMGANEAIEKETASRIRSSTLFTNSHRKKVPAL